ncbi:MAG: hypothetical protein ACI4PF_05425 [Christensenellales bacterium]
MAKKDDIFTSFKEKFSAMTKEERINYLRKNGLEFVIDLNEDNNSQVETNENEMQK